VPSFVCMSIIEIILFFNQIRFTYFIKFTINISLFLNKMINNEIFWNHHSFVFIIKIEHNPYSLSSSVLFS
jgi:hypothetical protein